MAKNTTKPADLQAESPSDVEAPEASVEDSASAYSDTAEGVAGSTSSSGLQGVPVAPEGPGLLLHSSFGQDRSKQIAARGAIKTAYYCVFGENLSEAAATEWSEGGVVLPSPETAAAMMKRVCGTLGVLTEVVGP